jgi:hypothetical protein
MSVYDDTPETEWPTQPRKRRAIDGPDRHTYQVLREQFRLGCAARRAPCWLCDEPIEYSLTGGPMAFECDHAIPVSVEPRLALDTNNFRASHAVCNRRRQAAKAIPITGEPSEHW